MSIWPTTESPRSFLLFAGLAIMGAVLGRRVWLDSDWRKLYPMLNLLLIGPSGVGKSTGLEIGFNSLVWSLPKMEQPQVISGAPTPEKLHDDLRANPHAILYASELANFFTKQKYMEGLIPYVTELLDYKPTIERRTKSGGTLVVEEPAVTVMGCSTVDWLQEQLPASAVGGGFLPRFLIVSEEHKAQKVALPGMSLSRAQREALWTRRADTIEAFQGLVAQLPSGAYNFKDYEAANAYAVWYSNHQPTSGHLAPFAARAGEFVQRLALLLALSRDRAFIDTTDVRLAVKMYHYSERKLQEVVVPYTQQGRLLALLLGAVGTGSKTANDIAKVMRNFVTAQDCDRLIESLVRSGDLVRTPNGRYRKATV